MSENSKKVNSVDKKGGFKALKNEFNKIMWPDKKTVKNKSVAVVIVTAILAAVIASLDTVIQTALAAILG